MLGRMISSPSRSYPTSCWRASMRRSGVVNAHDLQFGVFSDRTPRAPEPWDQPVRDFPGLVHLAPPINHPEDPLTAVIESFSRDRGASAIYVVDADDRLLGCIREQALDADLVTLVVPQRLWPAIREMDTRAVLRASRGAAPDGARGDGWRAFDYVRTPR